jgi:hypothetical protein
MRKQPAPILKVVAVNRLLEPQPFDPALISPAGDRVQIRGQSRFCSAIHAFPSENRRPSHGVLVLETSAVFRRWAASVGGYWCGAGANRDATSTTPTDRE